MGWFSSIAQCSTQQLYLAAPRQLLMTNPHTRRLCSGSWHLPWFTREAWPRGRRGRRPPTTVSPSWILIEILDSGSSILDPGYWVEIFNPGFEEVRRWSCCLAFLIKCKTVTFVN